MAERRTASEKRGAANTVRCTPASDATTLTVHVPIAFRRHCGRKTITTPEGKPEVSRTNVNSSLVRAIARAFRWRRLIENGIYASIQEIATAEKINASYVARVLRLTLLAPDIVESIVSGTQHRAVDHDSLKPFRGDWTIQRNFFLDE